jgi:thioesterase domain-containing protein/acyl carrier protein
MLEEVLGFTPVGVNDDFFELGGDSLRALQVVALLDADLDVELNPHAVLEATTAAELAEMVEAERRSEQVSVPCLTVLQPGEPSHVPLFLVHPVGGGVYVYRDFVSASPAECPIYAFQAAGMDGRTPARSSVDTMATDYLTELRAARPEGPYALGGAGFGGLVALEMAQRLRASGADVQLLMFDTPGPGQMAVRQHADMSSEAIDDLLQDRLSARGITQDGATSAQAGHLFAVYQANLDAQYSYQPKRYDGPILYFLAAERREKDPARPHTAWARLASDGVAVHRVPGDYTAMFQGANAGYLAAAVSEHLLVGAS